MKQNFACVMLTVVASVKKNVEGFLRVMSVRFPVIEFFVSEKMFPSEMNNEK